MEAAEFFLDFENVFHFGGAGEEGAEAVAESAFVFEGGIEVEIGLSDISHFDSTVGDSSHGFKRRHERGEVGGGDADGGAEVIRREVGGGDEGVMFGGESDGFFGGGFERVRFYAHGAGALNLAG